MNANWVAVDWGTSNVRAWAMSGDGQVLAETRSDKGMGQLTPAEFEPALIEMIKDWVNGPTDVLACGMVGAKQGWAEAPYATCPTAPTSNAIVVKTEHPDLNVQIIGGVKQDDPADVMRGEETQIAGFIALNPNWDGVVCLPGTHTKWVHISAGEIVSFQTVMTGEMFDLLASKSVLKHSVGDGWDDKEFLSSVDTALSRPEGITGRLFGIRASGLLDGLSEAASRARLSGYLIGAELAATKPYWLGQNVAMIGAQKLAGFYTAALQAQSVPVTQTDASQMTLQGLKAAYSNLRTLA